MSDDKVFRIPLHNVQGPVDPSELLRELAGGRPQDGELVDVAVVRLLRVEDGCWKILVSTASKDTQQMLSLLIKGLEIAEDSVGFDV